MSVDKDPRFVESGRRAARARWGPPRVVRLDALSLEQRRLVLALVEAARNEQAATDDQRPAAAQEVRRAADEPSAA